MNDCGECNICCTILKVKGVTKAKETCGNLCESGCSIYENRPDACSHFKCAYLTSNWKEEFRPDKSGIMVAGFKKEISVYRLKDDINKSLFNLIEKASNKTKVIGYDCRNL